MSARFKRFAASNGGRWLFAKMPARAGRSKRVALFALSRIVTLNGRNDGARSRRARSRPGAIMYLVVIADDFVEN